MTAAAPGRWPGDGRTPNRPRPRVREHRTPPARPANQATACPECGREYGTALAAQLCCTD